MSEKLYSVTYTYINADGELETTTIENLTDIEAWMLRVELRENPKVMEIEEPKLQP